MDVDVPSLVRYPMICDGVYKIVGCVRSHHMQRLNFAHQTIGWQKNEQIKDDQQTHRQLLKLIADQSDLMSLWSHHVTSPTWSVLQPVLQAQPRQKVVPMFMLYLIGYFIIVYIHTYITLHYITLHSIPLNYIPFH